MLGGCDGSNLFSTTPAAVPPATPPVDVRAETLRYLEEGALLLADDTPLRFRWMVEEAIPLRIPATTPPAERAAVLRAAALVEAAGGPRFREAADGPSRGAVRVEPLSPEAFRAVDPTRPWSFSRTFVTATPETGITEVRIALALDLEPAVLERATLHALGHAAGIMGHPAFPGGQFVMAASPEGGRPPTRFHPWEEAALRFLYSPAVRAGMTRREFRAAWAQTGG